MISNSHIVNADTYAMIITSEINLKCWRRKMRKSSFDKFYKWVFEAQE